MERFEYVITDEVGIHARPAGLLSKKAAEFESSVTITKGEKKADAKRLLAVMGLSVKQGDKIEVTIEGLDEGRARNELEMFFQKNL